MSAVKHLAARLDADIRNREGTRIVAQPVSGCGPLNYRGWMAFARAVARTLRRLWSEEPEGSEEETGENNWHSDSPA